MEECVCPHCGNEMHQVDAKELGKRLKQLRESVESKTLFTQERAAKKIGLSYNVYRRYEFGGYKVNHKHIKAISEFYGVSKKYLLGLEE